MLSHLSAGMNHLRDNNLVHRFVQYLQVQYNKKNRAVILGVWWIILKMFQCPPKNAAPHKREKGINGTSRMTSLFFSLLISSKCNCFPFFQGSKTGQHHEVHQGRRHHRVQADRLRRGARAAGRPAVRLPLRHGGVPPPGHVREGGAAEASGKIKRTIS